jgi:YHS domain-containing protein
MTFIARIVQFLFWLLVLRWGVRLVRYFLAELLGHRGSASEAGAHAAAGVEAPRAARQLVRDPVCGMHVDEALSIPLRAEGELVQFCSIACRDKYLASTRKIAANG